MTMACDIPADQLSVDFSQACSELSQARHRRQEKDSLANRAAVAEWQARIDLVLDMFLDLHGRGH